MGRWYLDNESPSWDFFLRRLAQAITAQFKKWTGRASLLFALLLAGCTPQLILQMTPVSPERVTWEHEITKMANDHDARIKALEDQTHPTGGPQ
jgi:hypothetical protein